MTRYQVVLATVASGSLLLAGCAASTGHGSSGTASGSLTPVQTALAWFRAINARDGSRAQSYFVPARAFMTEWVYGYRSTGPPFVDVRCRPEGRATTTANVYCTFKESPSPDEGNPDTFWSISMERKAGGRWLIDNYGQG